MNLKLIATLLALPLLAACAPEVESTIYLADVQTAVDKDEAISIPALIRIPQGGEDDCKKGLSDLVEKLKAFAPVTGKAQCISKDQHGSGTQLAEIETQVQIVPAGKQVAQPNLFVIEAATTDEGRTDLTFKMLRPIADVIKALTPPDAMSVDLDPAAFILHLNNDGAGTAEINLANVYVDGNPMVPENAKPVSIERRGVIEIRLSDVASSYVEAGNSYFFATIGPRG
ncbi:MAG: hypothetical protein ABI398_09580 [Devosia sp.]